jgi:hypothetical protein
LIVTALVIFQLVGVGVTLTDEVGERFLPQARGNKAATPIIKTAKPFIIIFFITAAFSIYFKTSFQQQP